MRLSKNLWLNNKGFTLIEISVVVALISIIAVLITINISWMDRVSVRAELDTLYAACHYLQQRALATNTPQELVFNPGANSYSYNTTTYHLPHMVEFGTWPGTNGPPASPSQVITKPITFVGNKITFYPEGIVQAGAIYIKDKKNNVQYALSSGVAPVSYLRKYQYTGEWKALT